MTKTMRYTIFTVLGLILLLIGAVLLINYNIKKKVEFFLTNRLPPNIEHSYSKLDLDIYEGTLTFNDVYVAIKRKKTDTIHTKVLVNNVIIENISYWDYLVHKNIHIEGIKLKSPHIFYYKQYFKASNDTLRKPPLKLFKPVLIDELNIDNATITILADTQNTPILYGENITVAVDDILVSAETLKKRLPVEFGDYDATADSIFVKINTYEELTAKNLFLKHHTATLSDITIKTKYSRSRLSEIIAHERDHFNLNMEKITVEGIDFGFSERKFFAKSTRLTLQNPKVSIYRDKLVADNPKIKNLYSTELRNLRFDLTVDEVLVKNGTVNYQERVHADNHGGQVSFHNLDANIKNVSNTYATPEKTTIDVNAVFMENTPVQVQWNFDVNDPSDRFLFQTTVGPLEASVLNEFCHPNLGVQLSGQVHKVYTTIDGNRNHSNADMKINYDNFKVTILTKDRKKKKRLLSAIANIFISKDSDKKGDHFREASYEVTPDRTKSVFNYVWLNVMEGLLKSITGPNKN